TAPDKSAEKLRQLLTRLQADPSLPPDRRDALTRVVQDRLRVVAAGPVAPTEVPAAVKPVGAEAERRAAETTQVRTALGEIAALARAGKSAEAHEKAAALVRERPNDLPVQAQSAAQGADARRADAASVRQDKERGIAAGLNSVERAAIMPSEDL